jgi:hypothetical protein
MEFMIWNKIRYLIGRLFSRAAGPIEGSPMTTTQQGTDSFAGWTIVYRIAAEYHTHFPGWASKVTEAISAALPGSVVKVDLFQENADEPFVIAPTESPEGEVERVRLLAKTAYEETARSVFIATPAVPSAPTNNPPRTPPPVVDETARVDANTIAANWLIIVPMFHLEISDNAPIYGQWKVGDVTFLSRQQLAATLRPPTLTNDPSPYVWQKIVDKDSSFATISLTGTPNALRRSVFFRLREAASILASTAGSMESDTTSQASRSRDIHRLRRRMIDSSRLTGRHSLVIGTKGDSYTRSLLTPNGTTQLARQGSSIFLIASMTLPCP